MSINAEAAYRALQSRDARFDGTFYTGVRTTGIYCRPSCAARTPLRANVDFFPSAAAAQRRGFRACKRCRPDATPGSAQWNIRADLAGRAVRLIADGIVDREGVSGLARRLGYSERQVNRTVTGEFGAPPLALARAQRAQTARVLLENTELPAADIAFAAGFASIRQFNDTIGQIFATTPTRLRRRAPRATTEPGTLRLRLAYRQPMDPDQTLHHLGSRAIAGLEHYDGTTYTRTTRLPHGPALLSLAPGPGHVRVELRLTDQRDLAAAVARVRRLLDLDADPLAVDETLAAQPALAPLIAARPGLRSPGALDGFEMAVRVIVGQQVSEAGARSVLGRIVAAHGEPVFDTVAAGSGTPAGHRWLLFPAAEVLAGLDPAVLPLTTARRRSVVALAAAVVGGEVELDAGSDRAETRQRLLRLPGVGPWTAGYLLMRALSDPDVFLDTDLVLRQARAALPEFDPAAAAPWRSYLTQHLWASLRARPVQP